jgi:hypothetical protein
LPDIPDGLPEEGLPEEGLPVLVPLPVAAVDGVCCAFDFEALGVAFCVAFLAFVGAVSKPGRARMGEGGADARIGLAASSADELAGTKIRQLPRPQINRTPTMIATTRSRLSSELVTLRRNTRKFVTPP